MYFCFYFVNSVVYLILQYVSPVIHYREESNMYIQLYLVTKLTIFLTIFTKLIFHNSIHFNIFNK